MASKSIYHHGDSVTRVQATKTKEQHVVDNDKLKADIKAYQEECLKCESEGKDIPQIPDSIGKSLFQIATILSRKYYFNGYSWIDDMVSDALIKCCDAVRKFDVNMGTSAFAYFTQTCYFEFIGRIQSEKKQKIVKASIVQNIGSQLEDVARQEIDADEEFHTAMAEILALNSVEIDYKVKEKKEKEIEVLPWDIFNVDENGMDKIQNELSS